MKLRLLCLIFPAAATMWAQEPSVAPVQPKPLPFQIITPPAQTNEDRLRMMLQRPAFRAYVPPRRVIRALPNLSVESKTCSIPLVNVTPPAKGQIQVIRPAKPVAAMPEIVVPAPPCESKP